MRGAAFPAAGFVLLLVLILLPGCAAKQVIDQGEAGIASSYRPGSPGFDIETVQVPGDSASAFELYLSVPYPSLIFEKAGNDFRSLCEVTARLSDAHTGQLAREVAWAETTLVARYEETQSSEPMIIRRRIAAPPASYRVDVTIEDRVDGRKASRAQIVTLFDPADAGPALGRISLMTRRRDGTTLPQISFFVPERPDSVRCEIGAYNFPSSAESRIDMRVIRFGVDTGVAVAPFYYALAYFSQPTSLVHFERPDTVYRASRSIRPPHRDEQLEFAVPPPHRGMYRIEFTASTLTRGGADTAVSAARYYSIQGPGFPRPVTYAELIDAAVYIATQREMSVLRSARDPEEQRKRFEEFWLSISRDPVHAAAAIKKYYGRVEEANRLFTNPREGWRSDRGMLYCILGPPADVRQQIETQTWFYDLSENSGNDAFVFTRYLRSRGGLTFEDYVLYREPAYEVFWNRMINKWRTGDPP